jgi:hypothetical protein
MTAQITKMPRNNAVKPDDERGRKLHRHYPLHRLLLGGSRLLGKHLPGDAEAVDAGGLAATDRDLQENSRTCPFVTPFRMRP